MDVKSLTEIDFNAEIVNGSWVVMFWASWCGPCIDISYLKEFASESGIQIARVNVEENPELAIQYSIAVVPTYIFFKQGQLSMKVCGLQTKESLNHYWNII